MRPTWEFLYERYCGFNRLIFGGVLPSVNLTVSNGARTLGCFIHPKRLRPGKKRAEVPCKIRISGRYDLEERALEDTIIHEMIHYFVWLQAKDTEPPHGPSFLKVMNDINHRFGRSVSVRGHLGSEERETDTTKRNNYICVTGWDDGKKRITVCARTCIFKIDRAWKEYPRVRTVEWFWSRDPWFNRYPLSRTPKAYAISDDELKHYVYGSSCPCVCTGTRFSPAR